MAEETETRNPNLEKLLQMGTIQEVAKAIDEAKTPSQLFSYSYDLVKILGAGLSDEDQKAIYGDIRNSPQEAMRYAIEGTNALKNEVQDWYTANKGSVIEQTASKINEGLSHAKTKAQAADVMVAYFNNLLSVPDMTQRDADNIAQKELAGKIGVKWNYSATGSIKQAEDLYKRLAVGEYVKEVADEEGKVSYAIDEAKLAKTMENVVPASVLYNTAMSLKVKDGDSKKE